LGIDLRVYRDSGLLTSEEIISRIEKRIQEKKEIDANDHQGNSEIEIEPNKKPIRRSKK
jgi:hypothetical protein